MQLIDTHCHLDAPVFDHDRSNVHSRAKQGNVSAIVIPATTAQSWPRIQSIVQARNSCYPAYGLHPQFTASHQKSDLDSLAQWLASEKPIAVGECGLDYYNRQTDKAAQMAYLLPQLELARQLDLPVILHARRATEAVLQVIRQFPGLRGVFHSYSGSLEQARQCAKLGFYFGFGGPVTWPGAHRLHKLVREIPLSTIVLETDAPDQPDAQHKGQRNEPSYLPIIAQTIAALKNMSVDEVAEVTSKNAHELFGLPFASFAPRQ